MVSLATWVDSPVPVVNLVTLWPAEPRSVGNPGGPPNPGQSVILAARRTPVIGNPRWTAWPRWSSLVTAANLGQPGPGSQFGGNPVEQQAIRGIYAILSDGQKKQPSTVLKQYDLFPMAGIPTEAAIGMRLANGQREKIASIAEGVQQTIHNAMDVARASGEFESVSATAQKASAKRHGCKPCLCQRITKEAAWKGG